MKTLKYIFVSMLAVFAVACNDGIDSISRVDPGPDETAPVVKILYPLEGTLIQVTEAVTSINIQVDGVDDIELESIAISLDGAEIAKFTEFKDYRHGIVSYLYDKLTDGKHTISATAKDLSGKITTESVSFEKVEAYSPKFDGEIFYMPFNGDYMDLVSIKNATAVGSPSFADGKSGKGYVGATDGYLTFPTAGLLGSEFSATFWYKLNSTPDRAGILTIGPADTSREKGFRFFRESGNDGQTFKLNVGDGAAESWFDGGATATLTTSDWVHIAFTISNSECVVYFNGEPVCQNAFTGVSWDTCDILSIGSGAPRFTEWSHLSDLSVMDELRLFNKALTSEEIKAVMK
ncbi:LamG domain-containing protein [Parabacteroides sp. PF5-9]|uniref:LamG domain-containing protein n=1 Tax=Parabacteroides sp. PF5-9 TaxID=1742404 RepID=UPI0024738820|nr:LamG domain-containing protein [Parabacteroides sp. PF5-9]MDH6357899.1 hypothetical protein [Parabacteroides sp. PF5-9]